MGLCELLWEWWQLLILRVGFVDWWLWRQWWFYFRCGSCGLGLVVVVVVDFWSEFCGLEVVPWWYLIWGWVLWIGGCSGGGG